MTDRLVDGQFILQVLAVLLGGAGVQLVIFLLRRRAEIRNLNTSSEGALVNSANQLVDRLQVDAVSARGEIARLSKRADDMQEQHSQERAEYTRRLEAVRGESNRLSGEIARLRTDLDIAHRQIEQLRDQLRRP